MMDISIVRDIGVGDKGGDPGKLIGGATEAPFPIPILSQMCAYSLGLFKTPGFF